MATLPSLSRALAAIEADIHSSAAYTGIGLIVPAGDRRALVHTRMPATIAVNVVAHDDIPVALRPPVGRPVVLSPLSQALREDGAIDRILAAWSVQAIVAVPIECDPGGIFWVGMPEARAFAAPEIDAVRAWADRLVAVSSEPETAADRDARLSRLDAIAEALPALGTALDMRDVFGQLSAIAHRVVPHESAVVVIFEADAKQIRLHALSATAGFDLPQVFDNPYPQALTRGWEYGVHRDLVADPLEGPLAQTHKGLLRSALRLPIRAGGIVIGALAFASLTKNQYTDADVPVARRIADYIALTLSHQRLAEEARRAEALRERTANLELLDGLLETLTGVLDIREVFGRVSEIARRVLPHDAMGLPLLTEDREHIIPFATVGLPSGAIPPRRPIPETARYLFADGWEFQIFDDMEAKSDLRTTPLVQSGYRSMLQVPVRLDRQVVGVLTFLSRQQGTFSQPDVLVARRIADHISLALSHQRMADEQRRAAALRERAANLEMLEGLLSTLSDVLDIREVFDRVSEVAQKVIAHDALSIAELIDNNERLRLYASQGLGNLPMPFEMPLPDRRLLTERGEYRVIDDLSQLPEYAQSPSTRAGMRSVLAMPIRVESRLYGGVTFYSKTPGRFTRDDVLVARRIADHIELAVSHQRLADKVRQNEELRARTSNLELLDELLATVTDRSELREVIDRLSAIAQKVLAHDAMVVPVLLPDGAHVRFHVTKTPAGSKFPDVIRIPERLRGSDWEYDICDDLQTDPVQRDMDAAKLGYRSALRVPIRVEGQLAAGIGFFSFTPGVYKKTDILVGRRIADRLALSLLRELGLEATRRADDASARAQRLESRVRALTDELDARTGYRRVVGESPEWRRVLTQATQVAATDTTVLLLGESGTGKEVVARFLHRASGRADGPFVALNCAALPEQLLEAELFGYERGAFTGATQSKPGQLEQASGGMLFLDEVAEMSPSAQAKFLRVLQEREFQRLGGTRVLRTDARVVAATNRDLHRAMQQGAFREDLFYRLNVFAIALPPLRSRREDVLPLSEAFLAEYARSLGRPPAGISRDARKLLLEYHWPGNVRELRNVLERAAILCDGGLITAEHLALKVAPAAPPAAVAAAAPVPLAHHAPTPSPPLSTPGDLQSMERSMIEQALQNARFNKSRAAKELGLTRSQLYVRMRRYGLE
jgi:transcriptional regulator with GAF, ATPase, and Fis domain